MKRQPYKMYRVPYLSSFAAGAAFFIGDPMMGKFYLGLAYILLTIGWVFPERK